MIAITKTIANDVFLLAFAVVESKNYRDWSWFIYHVRHLIVSGKEGIALIFNQHAAILSAVKDYWKKSRDGQPAGIYRCYFRHFKNNYQKKFNNAKVKDLIWKATTTY